MRKPTFPTKTALVATTIALSVFGLASCGDKTDEGSSSSSDDMPAPTKPKQQLPDATISAMTSQGCADDYQAWLENLVRWNSMQSGGTWQDVTVDFKSGTAQDGITPCTAEVKNLGIKKQRGNLDNITITIMAADASHVKLDDVKLEDASMIPVTKVTANDLRGASNIMDSAFAKGEELGLAEPEVSNISSQATEFIAQYDDKKYGLTTGVYARPDAAAWVLVESDSEQKGDEAAESSALVLANQIKSAVNSGTFTNQVYWEK